MTADLYIPNDITTEEDDIYIDCEVVQDNNVYTILLNSNSVPNGTHENCLINLYDEGAIIALSSLLTINKTGESEPSGDIGNSGTITNVSGDKTGNIDLSGIENRQDATNQKLDDINNSIKDIQTQISGDNEKLINTIIDGTPSGELLIPDIEIENPAENFYQNIYNHLINGLKNTDNVSITLKIPNGEGSFNDYIINSSDMAWSVPELDNFINLIWWLGFGYSLFKVVYAVYEHITQADFSKLEDTIKSDKDIL